MLPDLLSNKRPARISTVEFWALIGDAPSRTMATVLRAQYLNRALLKRGLKVSLLSAMLRHSFTPTDRRRTFGLMRALRRAQSAQFLSWRSIELQKPGFPRSASRVVEQPQNSASAQEPGERSALAVRLALSRAACSDQDQFARTHLHSHRQRRRDGGSPYHKSGRRLPS